VFFLSGSEVLNGKKPLNFANTLVNMISKFIENEAFTCQDFDF
jgi:hypothetical protein